MPGYLIDEFGERTHSLILVEEYERLARSAEKLERMREYASQMIAAMGDDADDGVSAHEHPHDSHNEEVNIAQNGHGEHPEHHHHEHAERQGGGSVDRLMQALALGRSLR